MSITQFTESLEALAGQVHRATDATLPEVLAAIVKETGASCVALGTLPKEWADAVPRDVEIVAPPYDAAKLPGTIDAADVGISKADFAIAEAGAVVELTVNDAERQVSTLPTVHICLVRADTILDTLEEAAPRLRDYFNRHDRGVGVTFISGPSRTADIELKLTLGVHGPEVFHAVIVE